VPEQCTCGARLPEDARFCHKCGKPQYDYPGLQEEPPPLAAAVVAPPSPLTPEIDFHNRAAVQTGLLAAFCAVAIFVIPLPLPFLRLLIAFVAAGFLAVYAYSRRTGQMLSIRSGARMGWITGVFAFAMTTALLTVVMIGISSQGGLAAFIRDHKEQFNVNGAQSDAVLQTLNDPVALAGGMLMSLLLFFVVMTMLPMLGGALGAKILDKE
jgi:hypothetical protein